MVVLTGWSYGWVPLYFNFNLLEVIMNSCGYLRLFFISIITKVIIENSAR